MGSFCSCFHVNDHGDSNLNSSNSNETSNCPNCCLLKFLINKCASLFNKDQRPAAAPSDHVNQEAVLPTSSFRPSDDIISDTITSQPRTLRFDNQFLHKDLEQLRDGDHNTSRECDNEVGKLTKLVSTQCCLSFSFRSPLKKVESEVANSEDEDVCPTCLEEYTPENPKIVTQCRHHYHLSCIYEWMERSPTCPVCSKVMVFDETI